MEGKPRHREVTGLAQATKRQNWASNPSSLTPSLSLICTALSTDTTTTNTRQPPSLSIPPALSAHHPEVRCGLSEFSSCRDQSPQTWCLKTIRPDCPVAGSVVRSPAVLLRPLVPSFLQASRPRPLGPCSVTPSLILSLLSPSLGFPLCLRHTVVLPCLSPLHSVCLCGFLCPFIPLYSSMCVAVPPSLCLSVSVSSSPSVSTSTSPRVFLCVSLQPGPSCATSLSRSRSGGGEGSGGRILKTLKAVQ